MPRLKLAVTAWYLVVSFGLLVWGFMTYSLIHFVRKFW